jgi:ribosomal protein S20
MPVTTSAKQALRKDRKRNLNNNKVRLKLREGLKEFRKAPSNEQLSQVYSLIDTAAKKNLIHHNKAARLKSQMSGLVNSDSSKTVPSVKPPTSAKPKKTAKSSKSSKKTSAKKTKK